MVNRNQGSGTRALIDRLLEGVKPAGYAVQPRNHNAVAAAVLQGRADWGVTLDIIARRAGSWIPPGAGRTLRLRGTRNRARIARESWLSRTLLHEPRVARGARAPGNEGLIRE